DGGFVTAGADVDGWARISRMDSLGNVIWTSRFGSGTGMQSAQCVKALNDGTFAFCGLSRGGSDLGYFVKFDSLGNSIWSWYYAFGVNDGGFYAFDERLEHDGFYLVGNNHMVRADAGGQEIWTRGLNLPDVDGYGITSLGPGAVVAVPSQGVASWYIDSTGTLIGVRDFYNSTTGPISDYVDVIPVKGGQYVFMGSDSSNQVTFPTNGGHDLILVWTDFNGNIARKWTLGNSDNEFGRAICQMRDGGIVAVGTRFSGAGQDAWMRKVRMDGSAGTCTPLLPIDATYAVVLNTDSVMTAFPSPPPIPRIATTQQASYTNQTQCSGTCTLPTVGFTWSNSFLTGTFNGTGSAQDYAWEFGDGTWVFGDTVTHTFASAGPQTVTVVGFNPCGCVTLVDSINIICTPANAAFSSAGVSLNYNFTDNSITSSVIFDWLWDFGDGTTSTLQNPSHAFPGAGDYNVCMTVTDSCGPITICDSVSVICMPPSANFFHST
ncbi:MAG: PKD domain-containing protein, partial [Bacteroidota bacterium]